MENLTDSKNMAIYAAVIAQEKKGHNTTVINFDGQSVLYDYVVITSALSTRETKAIAKAIDVVFKDFAPTRRTVQGMEAGHWILLDYGGIVIHIFAEQDREMPVRGLRPVLKDTRDSNYRVFYDLEGLWQDVPRLDFENMPQAEKFREDYLDIQTTPPEE